VIASAENRRFFKKWQFICKKLILSLKSYIFLIFLTKKKKKIVKILFFGFFTHKEHIISKFFLGGGTYRFILIQYHYHLS